MHARQKESSNNNARLILSGGNAEKLPPGKPVYKSDENNTDQQLCFRLISVQY